MRIFPLPLNSQFEIRNSPRYSQETGAPLVNEVFLDVPPSRRTCSALSILEGVSILLWKRNDGRLSQTLFEQAMLELRPEVIDHEELLATSVNDSLLFSASGRIAKHNLNATDAVTLRSALNLRQSLQGRGDELILWASDKRLLRAAQREGIAPFDHEEETIGHLHELLEISEDSSGGEKDA